MIKKILFGIGAAALGAFTIAVAKEVRNMYEKEKLENLLKAEEKSEGSNDENPVTPESDNQQ